MSEFKQNWHIDKSVSAGHLITTIVLIIGGLTYITDQDKRIEENKITIDYVKAQRLEDIARAESQRVEDNKRIEKQLDSINDKLDKLISHSDN